MLAKSNLTRRELLAASLLLFSTGGLVLSQPRREQPRPGEMPVPRQRPVPRVSQPKAEKQLPPRWDSPPEVTILKHEFGISKAFYDKTSPNPSNSTGEPSSRIATRVLPAVHLKIKNVSDKKITAMVWYFVLHNSADEEYFRTRFVSTTVIEAGKTKELMGEMERIPKGPRTVNVDELDKPPPPVQERIVVSCIMFADGTFSSFNDSTREDCESLKATQKNATRLVTTNLRTRAE